MPSEEVGIDATAATVPPGPSTISAVRTCPRRRVRPNTKRRRPEGVGPNSGERKGRADQPTAWPHLSIMPSAPFFLLRLFFSSRRSSFLSDPSKKQGHLLAFERRDGLQTIVRRRRHAC